MFLREILEKLVEKKEPVWLLDASNKKWEAGELLKSLPASILQRKAHIQQGLYIAEINDSGYLGSVLFKIKPK